MVKLRREGAKVIIAVKRRSDERVLWRLARDACSKFMKRLSKIEQIPNFIGYGLYDKCVVDAMRGLREPEPYFRGLVVEVVFERATVEYDQPPRQHGRSSYSLFSLADYALLGLSSYSRAPLRLMIFLGFFF